MLWPHTKTRVVFDKHQETAPAEIARRNSEIENRLFLLQNNLKRPIIIRILTTSYTFAQDKILRLDATSFLLRSPIWALISLSAKLIS